ncbi:uncharacterized protein C8Q71DRAFT_859579 [Rhodofomes roseus]|uniref:Uncharacterized protein n=1 Tax=Rhodofomes roseus TaxID=34475 RepID=A0ABQ8KBS5_9APHY|nr:uncharacterized protein C8Q71DRAFT_859579 [Rhodofomes roseus]KAH9834609.1 hypothetical protein C8Q71DRAFT_859579 [Rhodofomes roseus]
MIAVSFPRLPFNPSYTNHSHKFWQDLSEDQGAGDEPLALPEDSIDDSLRIEASRHGGGECAFTGPDKVGNTRVDVHWIFPPSMIIMISTWGAKKPFLPNIPDFRVSHNLLNMRDEIYQLWNSNAFSVDVDEAMNAGLPAHLTHIPAGGASDVYLREHFGHTLTVHLLGGDIGMEVGRIDWNMEGRTVIEAVCKCLERKKLKEDVNRLIIRDYEEWEFERRF